MARYWRIIAEEPDYSGTGPNEPCPCGSGKKYKKCHRLRKPRVRHITFDFGSSLAPDPDRIEISPTGAVTFRAMGSPLTPVHVSSSSGFHREKGRKVLYDVPLAGTNPSSALERFDAVFAVDTNTRLIDGRHISATAVCEAFLTPAGPKLMAEFGVTNVWLGADLEEPEREGWRLFLELVTRDRYVPSGGSAVLVVDSHLELIPSIGRRATPVHGDFLLPEAFTLVYASDHGSDFLGTRMVQACHRVADEVLDRASDGEQALPP